MNILSKKNKKCIRQIKKHYKLTLTLYLCFSLILFVYIVTLSALRMIFSHFNMENTFFFRAVFATYSLTSICVILAFATQHFVLHVILRPVQKISKAYDKISKGDYNVKLEYNGRISEMEDLINNFNIMSKNLNSVEMIRNDFIANVSHEFKTPLSSIVGYVTLLDDPDITKDEQQEYIEKIKFNIEKLNDLTSNILLISKLDTQSTHIENQTYRIDEQLREAIVILEPKWSKRNISFDLDLPDTMYTGPKSLIFQIWMNIITNAIKFSHEAGEIKIKLSQKNDMTIILISDNGIGMDKETQEHIFDKFYQGDTSRKSKGNGLGLALCKKIVECVDGNIYVSSQKDVGSTFMIQLPCLE